MSKYYRVNVGAFGGRVQGDVVQPSDLPEVPAERFKELVRRGDLSEISADEAEILATNRADSDREAGAVEDQFADQTRGDALRVAARIAALEEEGAEHRRARQEQRDEIEGLKGQLALMKQSLEARSAGQEQQATDAARAAGAPAPRDRGR